MGEEPEPTQNCCNDPMKTFRLPERAGEELPQPSNSSTPAAPDNAETTDSGISAGGWAGIGVAIAVLIAFAMLWFYLHRKKAKGKSGIVDMEAKNHEEPRPETGGHAVNDANNTNNLSPEPKSAAPTELHAKSHYLPPEMMDSSVASPETRRQPAANMGNNGQGQAAPMAELGGFGYAELPGSAPR